MVQGDHPGAPPSIRRPTLRRHPDRGPNDAARTTLTVTLVRNIDLAVLAAALVVFLVAELPLAGWLTAAVVWGLWRGIGAFAERKAQQVGDDPRKVAGILAGATVGRGWLMGLVLIAVGLSAGDDVGLSAAVLSVVLFTVWFTTKMVLRPFEQGTPHTTP